MTIPAQVANVSNPFSGVFGNGEMQIFASSGTFNVPVGVSRVRVRLWGGGGGFTTSAAAGGFAMRVIQLGATTSVAVTVGAGGTSNQAGTTSSFGSFVSATGGGQGLSAGGTGVGGDINYVGGGSSGTGGGSAPNIFGNGYITTLTIGASGPFGTPASSVTTSGAPIPPTSGMIVASIDFLGTGGGGATGSANGINGGGSAGNTGFGGFPGGGGYTTGGRGLVIVEY